MELTYTYCDECNWSQGHHERVVLSAEEFEELKRLVVGLVVGITTFCTPEGQLEPGQRKVLTGVFAGGREVALHRGWVQDDDLDICPVCTARANVAAAGNERHEEVVGSAQGLAEALVKVISPAGVDVQLATWGAGPSADQVAAANALAQAIRRGPTKEQRQAFLAGRDAPQGTVNPHGLPTETDSLAMAWAKGYEVGDCQGRHGEPPPALAPVETPAPDDDGEGRHA
jgi:hypothetical protein